MTGLHEADVTAEWLMELGGRYEAFVNGLAGRLLLLGEVSDFVGWVESSRPTAASRWVSKTRPTLHSITGFGYQGQLMGAYSRMAKRTAAAARCRCCRPALALHLLL